ncbi:MAG: type III pantothenate kinase [Ruminiclostridium sp.]|nr:type III pantothenate kinase [Ruminiclostridium sp.]
MLMTIDVGNTNTVFGVFNRNDEIVFGMRVQTNAARMADEYTSLLRSHMELDSLDPNEIDSAIISSVVPPVTEQIRTCLRRLFGIDCMIVGPGVKTGLNIRIDDPATLGADMCCAGVAAKTFYTLPGIIIDLGTASKVFAVNGRGDFLGGIISVGVEMAFSGLSRGTAALPLITGGDVTHTIGTNTVDSMRAGVIVGMASMMDGFIERFTAEMGEVKTFIATGGYSPLVIPYCRTNNIIYDSDLLLKGMLAIYKKNR